MVETRTDAQLLSESLSELAKAVQVALPEVSYALGKLGDEQIDQEIVQSLASVTEALNRVSDVVTAALGWWSHE